MKFIATMALSSQFIKYSYLQLLYMWVIIVHSVHGPRNDFLMGVEGRASYIIIVTRLHYTKYACTHIKYTPYITFAADMSLQK